MSSEMMTPERAREIIDRGGQGTDRALVYLTTDAFLRRPEEIEETISYVDENIKFRPSPGKPTREHAIDRIILAGTMGVTYFLLAQDSLKSFLRSGRPPELGPPGCYVVPAIDGGEPMVAQYDDPRKDAHMRSIIQLTNSSKRITEQSHDPDSPYAQYVPVWECERAIRGNMLSVSHHRNTQLPTENINYHPLNHEVVQGTGAQFMRNVMHHMLLTADSLPPSASVAEIQRAVIDKIVAAETAAQYPRETQRTYMGIPGSGYERQRERREIVPRMVSTDGGARVAGLESSPPNPSMCPGPDSHEIPKWLQDEFTPSPIGSIGMLALWGVAVAPYTLFQDSGK